MRVVIQRVSEASVTIDGQKTTSIGKGLMILLGITHDDTRQDIDWLVGKISKLRIFADEDGAMNIDISQAGGGILVVSQFTLHASTRKGNRPSFIEAARPEIAIPLYEKFITALSEMSGREVKHGVFGADMKVGLINEGPVTIIMDSKEKQ